MVEAEDCCAVLVVDFGCAGEEDVNVAFAAVEVLELKTSVEGVFHREVGWPAGFEVELVAWPQFG